VVLVSLSGCDLLRQLLGLVVQLTVLEVTPFSSTVEVGQTQEFIATGHYTDGTEKRVEAGEVTWSSSDSSVATVSSSGIATGVSSGTILITATSTNGNAVNGSATLTVVESDSVILSNIALAISFSQSYNEALTPSWYYIELQDIEDKYASQRRSWRDLYEVGAISATVYEQKIIELNAAEQEELGELEDRKYALDNYYPVLVSYRIENENDLDIEGIRFYVIARSDDLTEFMGMEEVSAIPANLFLTGSFSIDTQGKKVIEIEIERTQLL